jgi:DNA (cytosine-5)-methyltransferase 1
VRAFLVKYFGSAIDGQDLGEPLHTVTAKPRFGLIVVTIDGEEYAIADIGMRMLTKREQFNAQGFPPDYIIDRDIHGRPITETAQQAKCGNSVCPPIARALVAANASKTAEGEPEAVAA